MERSGLRNVLKYLQRQALRHGGGLSDAQLLERFVRSRDEAAFELLVWRYGPLVVNVCRRLLRHEHDVDDAFQATFAALACKARTIRKQACAAPWLYRVAYRAALAARTRSNRHVSLLPEAEPLVVADDDLLWRDLRPVLDAEVQKLAEKYRSAFVLCYLQGLTHGEAAAHLGCPEGTIHSRLATAKAHLRRGLERRGVTLSGTGLALEFVNRQFGAPPTAQLIQQTMTTACSIAGGPVGGTVVNSSVITLTKGVLFTMWIQSYTAPVLVTLALSLVGVGVLGYRGVAGFDASDEPNGNITQKAASKPPALPQVQPLPPEQDNAEATPEPTAGMDLDNTLLKLMMDEKTLRNRYGPDHAEIQKLRRQIKFLNDLIVRREAARNSQPPAIIPEGVADAGNRPNDERAKVLYATQLQKAVAELEVERRERQREHHERRRQLKLALFSAEEELRRQEQHARLDLERSKKMLQSLDEEVIALQKTKRMNGLDEHKTELLERDHSMVAKQSEELRKKDEIWSRQSFEMRIELDKSREALKDEEEQWTRNSSLLENRLSQLQSNLLAFRTVAQFPQLANIPAVEDAKIVRLENKLDQVIRELAEVKKQLEKSSKD